MATTTREWADSHTNVIVGSTPIDDGWENVGVFLRNRAHDETFRDMWDELSDQAGLRVYCDTLELVRQGRFSEAEAMVRGIRR